MDRKNTLVILSLVTLAAIVGSTWLIVSGSGQEDDNSLSPKCRGPRRLGLQLDLTEEQREAIQTRVQEMSEAGASREEIRAEITAMLTEWGIELPERPECRGPRRSGLQLDLTEEQREAIQTRVQEMSEAGASREEIRVEITAMLTEWGIELPERPEWQDPSPPWMDALTEEQREAIQTRVQEMSEVGASREEIRAEITAMLTEWGIELPEYHGLSPPCGGNRFRFSHPLKASP